MKEVVSVGVCVGVFIIMAQVEYFYVISFFRVIFLNVIKVYKVVMAKVVTKAIPIRSLSSYISYYKRNIYNSKTYITKEVCLPISHKAYLLQCIRIIR